MVLGNVTNMTTQAVTVQTTNWFVWFVSVVIPKVVERFWQLLSAPFNYPHMQWIIIPLVLTFVAAEFYFFRHVNEELSWNTALLNSLVLIFVAIDLTRTVFNDATPVQVAKLFVTSLETGSQLSSFLVIIFIGGLGLALAIINFFHILPRKLAAIVSSHAPINFIAYFAAVEIYSASAGTPLPLDGETVAAAVILFTILVYIVYVLQRSPGQNSWQNVRGGS